MRNENETIPPEQSHTCHSLHSFANFISCQLTCMHTINSISTNTNSTSSMKLPYPIVCTYPVHRRPVRIMLISSNIPDSPSHSLSPAMKPKYWALRWSWSTWQMFTSKSHYHTTLEYHITLGRLDQTRSASSAVGWAYGQHYHNKECQECKWHLSNMCNHLCYHSNLSLEVINIISIHLPHNT